MPSRLLMDDQTILLLESDFDNLSASFLMLYEEFNWLIPVLTRRCFLNLLRQTVPAVVIMDRITLGSQYVHGLLSAIRADKRLRRTKCILLTSYMSHVSPAEHLLSDTVLYYPLQKGELAQAVRSLLGARVLNYTPTHHPISLNFPLRNYLLSAGQTTIQPTI